MSQNAPLQAGVTNAYGGALPGLAASPEFQSMSQEDKSIDLVRKIRRIDPSFAQLPTGVQLDFVKQKVLPVVQNIKPQNELQRFVEGAERGVNPTDFRPATNPSAAYEIGKALGNFGGQIGSGVAGKLVGKAIGSGAGLLTGPEGAALGGAIGENVGQVGGQTLFATASRQAEMQRQARQNFDVAPKPYELSELARTLPIDLATSSVGHFLPTGKTPIQKVLFGTASGAGISGAASAADQLSRTGRVDTKELWSQMAFGALTGAAVPVASAVAPKVLRASARYQKYLDSKTVVRGGRRAQRGFIGVPPEEQNQALNDIFPNGKPEGFNLEEERRPVKGFHRRQYNSELTNELVKDTPLNAEQQAVNAEVDKAVQEGRISDIDDEISKARQAGNQVRVQLLYNAAASHPGMDETTSRYYNQRSQNYRSQTATSLRAAQEDPRIKARNELIQAVVEKGKTKDGEIKSGELEKLTNEALKILEDSYRELFKIAARLLKQVDKTAPKKVRKSTPKKSGGKGTAPVPKKSKVSRDKTRELLARAFAEDVDKEPGQRKDQTAGMSPEEKEVYLWAKARLRDRRWLSRQLKPRKKGQLNLLSPEERKLTAVERDLYRRMKDTQKAKIKRQKGEDKIRELLARAIAEDFSQSKPLKAGVEKDAWMTPEQKAVNDFAKRRIRDRKWLANQLKLKGYKPKESLTLEQRSLTEAERNLVRQKPPVLNLRIQKVKASARRRNPSDIKTGKDLKDAWLAVSDLNKPPRLKKTAEQLRNQRETRLALETIDQRQERLLKAAATHIGTLERSLNPQGQLALKVKQQLSKDITEGLALLSPQMQQHYKDLLAQQFKAHIDAKYGPKTRSTPKLKTTLDRLFELKSDGVLDPEHMDYALKGAIESHVMKTQDFQEFNQLLDRLEEPGLSSNELLRREALLQKFIFDRKAVGVWDKYINFRYMGMLLQAATQARNYVDGLGYAFFRTGILNTAEAGYDKALGVATGRRTIKLRVNKADRDFFHANEPGLRDELSNLAFDLKNGTNTSRTKYGDVANNRGLQRGFLPEKLDTPLQSGVRTLFSAQDRFNYALGYEQAFLSELAIYRKAEGKYPVKGSQSYEVLKARAEARAAETNYTNRGVVESGLNALQKGVTYGGDAIGQGLGLMKEGESLQLGRFTQPFTTILGNSSTKPLELIPGLGAFGIYVNRAFQAKVNKVPIDHQNTVAHILAAQSIGLVIGAGGVGALTPFLYQMGYHHVYIQGNAKKQTKGMNRLQSDVGATSNSFNMTAFFRFFSKGAKDFNDMEPQSGDTYLPMRGYGTIDSIMRAGTATGAEDRANNKPAEPRGDLVKGIVAFAANNDAASGINRPFQTLSETRNPDTGEPDALWGTAKLAADTVGFKVPGQDLIPSTRKEPTDLLQVLENSNPITATLVPSAVGASGADEPRNTGAPTQYKGPETTSGFLYELAQKTGKESHVMQAIGKKLKSDDGDETVIPYKDRQQAQRSLNKAYYGLVEQVRTHETFNELDPRQQVQVLSRVKNDLTKAFMATAFGVEFKGVTLRKTEGGYKMDWKDKAQRGAVDLVNNDTDHYESIIEKYIRNARDAQRLEERVKELRNSMRESDPELYHIRATGRRL
jgi:hypothetical protein